MVGLVNDQQMLAASALLFDKDHAAALDRSRT